MNPMTLRIRSSSIAGHKCEIVLVAPDGSEMPIDMFTTALTLEMNVCSVNKVTIEMIAAIDVDVPVDANLQMSSTLQP